MEKKISKIKILLTGGGSGGHIYPLSVVHQELKKLIEEKGFSADIRYFGSPGFLKNYFLEKNIRVSEIPASKMRRYFDLKNFLDMPKFAVSAIKSLWKVFWFMPHACFSKGGPGALAVLGACRFYNIPSVIHDSDSIPGLTTKIASSFARIIELSFESAREYIKTKNNLNLVGIPVRENLLEKKYDSMVKTEFGLNPDLPVIFFFGGSQGAEMLNQLVFENIKVLTENFQVIHQVGPTNYDSYKKEFDFMYGREGDIKNKYAFSPYFTEDLDKAYAASDIVVSRAGGSAIFECAALGKPMVLVPLPDSAQNHQIKNAYEYAKTGAALVIEQENLLPNLLIGEIKKILGDGEKLKKMSEAARNFYIPDSGKKIAVDILSVII